MSVYISATSEHSHQSGWTCWPSGHIYMVYAKQVLERKWSFPDLLHRPADYVDISIPWILKIEKLSNPTCE